MAFIAYTRVDLRMQDYGVFGILTILCSMVLLMTIGGLNCRGHKMGCLQVRPL
jgi:hypothetical protein